MTYKKNDPYDPFDDDPTEDPDYDGDGEAEDDPALESDPESLPELPLLLSSYNFALIYTFCVIPDLV